MHEMHNLGIEYNKPFKQQWLDDADYVVFFGPQAKINLHKGSSLIVDIQMRICAYLGMEWKSFVDNDEKVTEEAVVSYVASKRPHCYLLWP